MLVPVRVEGASNEWSIVELQGALISDDGAAAIAGGLDIGALRYVDGVPTLRIGNHILAGKVAKLPKPLAILRKDESSGAAAAADSSGDQQRSDGAISDSSVDLDVDVKQSSMRMEYEVVGIARSRVVFSSRPKPVLVE